MQFFLKHQYNFFIIPAFLCVLAVLSIMKWGLTLGIDLTGGSLLEVVYPEGRPSIELVREQTDTFAERIGAEESIGEVRVQPFGDNGLVLRTRDLTPTQKDELVQTLSELGTVEEKQFNSVGPSIGKELMAKAWWAIGLVILSIILFVAFAFRHVSKPVSSWKYGVVVIVTLLHDILLPTGLFAYLGYAQGAEVDVLFIVALLTILGISVNDTIVVFDRIRENLRLNTEKKHHESFAHIVARSTMQTLARSINTSITVIIVLVALFYYGPASTKDFALTLIVGMVAGTYSSIFLASPLLVLIEKYQKPPKEKPKTA
jgi:preprotein translocase subunit SecF